MMAADLFLFARALVLLQLWLTARASERPSSLKISEVACQRPAYVEHASMARYVAHLNSWGSVASLSSRLGNLPYAAVESYSDGPLGNSTGRLLFYLTALDDTGMNVMANSNVTFSLAEIQIPGSCQGTDPEDPTCAKVSITGQMLPVPAEDLDQAESLLFSRHPAMQSWPRGHHFILFELHISAIRLLDFYGGAADLTAQQYFEAKISCSTTHLELQN